VVSRVPTAAPPAAPVHWPSVLALNAVSTLAQIGQYGIGFALVPLALEARGAAPWQIGAISAATWIGMLAGLVAAPRIVSRIAHRRTVLCGLVLSSAALLLMPELPWVGWALPAAALGFGLGLRWIGNETWLYQSTPGTARGRIVGIHESLIGIASVAGPALIAAVGVADRVAFVVAALCTALAAAPTFVARAATGRTTAAAVPHSPTHAAAMSPSRVISGAMSPSRVVSAAMSPSLWLGAAVAGAGGVIDAAWLGLYPVYAAGLGMGSSDTAWMLSVFGLGAVLLQWPIGWLADARGARVTAGLCAAATLLAAASMSVPGPSIWLLAAQSFVLGSTTAGFLTLGMIAATRSAEPARMAAEVSQVSIAYTAGAGAGPLLAGALVSGWGVAGLQGLVVAAALAIGLFVARRAE
jgi:MFS family permease